jgi:hypothetical protein
MMGLVMLGLGVLGWYVFSGEGIRLLARLWITDREISWIAIIGPIALLVFLAYGSRRLIDAIRASDFWQERGYVKGMRWQVSRPIYLISGTVVVVMLVASFWLFGTGALSQETLLRVMVSSAGIGTGIVYLGMGVELRLWRHRVVGASGVIFSAAIIPLQLPFSLSWLALGIGWMAILGSSALCAMRGKSAPGEGSPSG